MASISMSSATASTYTCGHDGIAAGRVCRRSSTTARGVLILGIVPECDVAGRAPVLRQPAERLLAHHGRALRLRHLGVLRHRGWRHCTRHGVAVWDVLHSCRRAGSLDSEIDPKSMVVNDFGRFFDTASVASTRVLFNGATAARTYERLRRHRGDRVRRRCRRRVRNTPSATTTSCAPGETASGMTAAVVTRPAGGGVPTAVPSRSAHRATAASPRRTACPPTESTSARHPRRGPTAPPRRADPFR